MRFKKKEVLVLNQSLPVYFAASQGLFRVKVIPKRLALAPVIGLAPLVYLFLAVLIFADVELLHFNPFSLIPPPPEGTPTWEVAVGYALVFALYIAFVVGPFVGLYYYTRLLIKAFKDSSYVEGELVAEWSDISHVVITNERAITRGWSTYSRYGAVSVTYGDWHVFTRDGREIVIPNIRDPHNTLNYLRAKYRI
ncbi:MAG: hypothetical protein ACP5HQ_03435 [Thermoprotei archaeon]